MGNVRLSSRFVGSPGAFANGSGNRSATPDRFDATVIFGGRLCAPAAAGSSSVPCQLV